MHRQTPLTQGFVGYTSGGSRTLIESIDDDKNMQHMKGSMMFGEARDKVEAPQNYGFSSVVRPATKGKDGKIEDCAEGYMSYSGGNRSASYCAVMDDRRYRPMGLKPGENAQYDDVGQMTLLRRTGVYVLTNDNEEDKQQGQGGGAAAPGQHADSGGSQQKPERFVSVRHVEKKKQERPKRGSQSQGGGQSGGGGASAGTLASTGQSGGQKKEDFKHEGESVNNEMRVSKKRIEFRSGDDVVGYYDKASKTWCFIGKVKLGTEDAQHPVYGVNGGKGMTVDPNGSDAVLVNAPKPGPPTSEDAQP
jgi:phage gp45-like